MINNITSFNQTSSDPIIIPSLADKSKDSGFLSAEEIPSESLPPNLKNHHQLLANQWISQFGDDYIAHTVWNGNFAGVVKRKEVLPAEALLRERGPVEYEEGDAFGQRSRTQLESFPQETFEEIDQHLLSPEQKESLLELEKFFENKTFSIEEKYLKKLRDNDLFLRKIWSYEFSREEEEQIENIDELSDKLLGNKFLCVKEGYLDAKNHRNQRYAYEYWNEAKVFIETQDTILTNEEEASLNSCTEQNGPNSLDIEKRLALQELLYKIMFRLEYVRLKKSKLKYYYRIQEGITFNKPCEGFPCRLPSRDNPEFKNSRYPCVFYRQDNHPTIKNFINYKFKFIAHDLHKNNAIDNYLTSKYDKWIKKWPDDKTTIINRLYLTRQNRLISNKLNPEIRAERNSIRWSYGDISVLRGNPSSIIAGDCNFEQNVDSGEVLLLSPWMNNGKFFSLPLVQDETLILGKEGYLQPFAKELDQMGAKYAYLENLTAEQKSFFNFKHVHANLIKA